MSEKFSSFEDDDVLQANSDEEFNNTKDGNGSIKRLADILAVVMLTKVPAISAKLSLESDVKKRIL